MTAPIGDQSRVRPDQRAGWRSRAREMGLMTDFENHTVLAVMALRRRVRYIQEAVAFGLFLPGLELFHRFTLYEPVCDERPEFDS